MKNTELRIGNWVDATKVKGQQFAVREDDFYFILKFPDNYEPIPITEEWLIKLGFKHINGEEQIWKELKLSGFDELWWLPGLYFIEKDVDTFKLYHCTDEDTYWQLKWLKYVHQLQNIYFDLEDEELNTTL